MNLPRYLMRYPLTAAAVMFLSAIVSTQAIAVPKDLPYPNGSALTAKEVIEQVYFVNHSFSVGNVAVEKKGKRIATIVSTVGDGSPSVNTLVRYLNNNYDDGIIKARDMIIFKSGKLKGTGYLMTLFEDDEKSPTLRMWLPMLRKVRLFAAPAQNDTCCSANMTYGDLFMRKPEHEAHELQGQVEFDGCLGAMDIPRKKRTKKLRYMPEAQCGHKGKQVYKVKSTTKFKNWWYDYRVSFVDPVTFGDYRVLYYKDGEEIKRLEKDWTDIGLEDKRGIRPNYIYTHTYDKDIRSLIIVPEETVSWDRNLKDSLWTEKTLRKQMR